MLHIGVSLNASVNATFNETVSCNGDEDNIACEEVKQVDQYNYLKMHNFFKTMQVTFHLFFPSSLCSVYPISPLYISISMYPLYINITMYPLCINYIGCINCISYISVAQPEPKPEPRT